MAVVTRIPIAVHVAQVDTRVVLGGDAAVRMASRQLATCVVLHAFPKCPRYVSWSEEPGGCRELVVETTDSLAQHHLKHQLIAVPCHQVAGCMIGSCRQA